MSSGCSLRDTEYGEEDSACLDRRRRETTTSSSAGRRTRSLPPRCIQRKRPRRIYAGSILRAVQIFTKENGQSNSSVKTHSAVSLASRCSR